MRSEISAEIGRRVDAESPVPDSATAIGSHTGGLAASPAFPDDVLLVHRPRPGDRIRRRYRGWRATHEVWEPGSMDRSPPSAADDFQRGLLASLAPLRREVAGTWPGGRPFAPTSGQSASRDDLDSFHDSSCSWASALPPTAPRRSAIRIG